MSIHVAVTDAVVHIFVNGLDALKYEPEVVNFAVHKAAEGDLGRCYITPLNRWISYYTSLFQLRKVGAAA